jgi:hypothetical protein
MTDANIEAVHRKTRQRLLFTGIHLVGLGGYLGETRLTGSLMMFVVLVFTFILLETIFLVLSRREAR